MIILKKLITAVIISVIAILSFTGCGLAQDAADGAGEMVSDAADGAEDMASDAADVASDFASDVADNTDGVVDDDDGIIDNEDNETNGN